MRWTKEEVKCLRELSGCVLTSDELVLMFENRSKLSLSKKIRSLKLNIKIKRVDHRTWSDDEIELLTQNHNNPNLFELFDRDRTSVVNKLTNIGLSRDIRIRWTTNDDKFLINNYHDMDKDMLISKLKRSWDAVKLRANKLGVDRSRDFQRNSNMSKLDDGSLESYYWLGFLLADGHFQLETKRISLGISTKDIEHILKYSKFIETDNITIDKKNIKVSVSIQNIEMFDNITSKLKLSHSDKTINPNCLRSLDLNKEEMFSLIVGFIDGDGNISHQHGRKTSKMRIQVHSNWLDNLIFIEEFIYKYFGVDKETISKVNNSGYAMLSISDFKLVREIKREVNKLKLPILTRKWSIIDENFKMDKEIILENRKIITNMYLSGLKPTEIIKQTDFTGSLIYSTIRKLKS